MKKKLHVVCCLDNYLGKDGFIAQTYLKNVGAPKSKYVIKLLGAENVLKQPMLKSWLIRSLGQNPSRCCW